MQQLASRWRRSWHAVASRHQLVFRGLERRCRRVSSQTRSAVFAEKNGWYIPKPYSLDRPSGCMRQKHEVRRDIKMGHETRMSGVLSPSEVWRRSKTGVFLFARGDVDDSRCKLQGLKLALQACMSHRCDPFLCATFEAKAWRACSAQTSAHRDSPLGSGQPRRC